MIVDKKSKILSDPAYKNFINKIKDLIQNKIVFHLKYSREDSQIINDIKLAKRKNAEIILSEIMPNEMPSSLLLEEFNFFIKRYIFLDTVIPQIQVSLKHEFIVVHDNDSLTGDSKTSNIITDHLIKNEKAKFLNVFDNTSFSEIISICAEFKKIIINLTDSSVIYHLLKFCKDNKKMFSLGFMSRNNLSRFVFQGYTVKSRDVLPHPIHSSVREKVSSLLTFKYFDEIFENNNNPEIDLKDLNNINYNWSIPHECKSQISSSQNQRLARFEMLSLNLLLNNKRIQEFKNIEYLYLIIAKNIFLIKDFHTRIRFLRDVAKVEKINHNIFFKILKYNFTSEHDLGFQYEFLIACLFARNNPHLAESNTTCINEFISLFFAKNNNFTKNESQIALLTEAVRLIANYEPVEFNNFLTKNRRKMISFGFLLECLPSLLSNEQLENLISCNDFIFEKTYFHYFFRGLLYANDLDEFEISVFCINNKFEKSLYSNLYETLLNDKVLDAILPVNSNIIYILFKDISFKKDLTQTSFPAKLAVARLFMLTNDNESAIEVLSTTNFSEIDDVDSIALLSFFRIWNRLGITQKNINIPKDIEEIPHKKRFLLWDLYSYMKDTDYDFEFDIKRINEEKNEFSWHL